MLSRQRPPGPIKDHKRSKNITGTHEAFQPRGYAKGLTRFELVLRDFGELLRMWGFTLEWMLLRSKGNFIFGQLNRFNLGAKTKQT